MQSFLLAFSAITLLFAGSAYGSLPHAPFNAKRSSTTFGCSGAVALSSNAVYYSNCDAGQSLTCQVVDSSCKLAEGTNIQSLVVKEAGTSQALGGSSNVATASFTCPSSTMFECSVALADPSTAKDLGIRVVTGSGN